MKNLKCEDSKDFMIERIRKSDVKDIKTTKPSKKKEDQDDEVVYSGIKVKAALKFIQFSNTNNFAIQTASPPRLAFGAFKAEPGNPEPQEFNISERSAEETPSERMTPLESLRGSIYDHGRVQEFDISERSPEPFERMAPLESLRGSIEDHKRVQEFDISERSLEDMPSERMALLESLHRGRDDHKRVVGFFFHVAPGGK